MNPANRVLRVAVVLVLALLLSGCISISEEIWINKNLSGEVKVEMTIPEKVVAVYKNTVKSLARDQVPSESEFFNSSEIQQRLSNIPKVSNVNVTQFSDEGKRHFLVAASVEDFQTIPIFINSLIANYDSETQTSGSDISFTKKSSNPRLITFSQSSLEKDTPIQDNPVETDKKDNNFWSAVTSILFSDEYFTVRLHAPKIVSANGKISDDKKEVTWKIPIFEADSWEKLEADFLLNY